MRDVATQGPLVEQGLSKKAGLLLGWLCECPRLERRERPEATRAA